MNILRKIKKTYLGNDWTNKTVVVFGDSIVAGQELIREQTPYRDIVYAKIASQYLNARVLHNFAETGTGQFKGQQNLDRKTGWVHNFEKSITRYKPEVKLADVIIIAYGNNDWKQPNPDGSMHSIEEVKQKLRDNINHLRKINPSVKIVGVLETVAFRKGKLAWLEAGPNEFTYEDMIDAYISVYNELNVAIFDIRDYHIGNALVEYVDDRDHFTKAIHRLMGEALVDFVKHKYQSPADREPETRKIILEQDVSGLLDSLNSNQNLLHDFMDSKVQNEFLFSSTDENIDGDIEQLKLKFPELGKMMFTNMFDYFDEYYNNRAFIHPVASNNVNEVKTSVGDFAYLRQDVKNNAYALSTGEGAWHAPVTQEQLKTNWLKQYLSTKDDIWSFNEGILKKTTIFDVNNR